MTATISHRVPGGTPAARCGDCSRVTFDNFADQWCADCLVGHLRHAVEEAERWVEEAAALADTADGVAPADLLERATRLAQVIGDE